LQREVDRNEWAVQRLGVSSGSRHDGSQFQKI
jgi:hypothetical protein